MKKTIQPASWNFQNKDSFWFQLLIGGLCAYFRFARELACAITTHALATEPNFTSHLGGSDAYLFAQLAQGGANFIRWKRADGGTVLAYPKDGPGIVRSLKKTNSVVKKNLAKNLLVTQEPERAINSRSANGRLTETGHHMKFFGGKCPVGGQRRLYDGAAHRTLSDEPLKLRRHTRCQCPCPSSPAQIQAYSARLHFPQTSVWYSMRKFCGLASAVFRICSTRR